MYDVIRPFFGGAVAVVRAQDTATDGDSGGGRLHETQRNGETVSAAWAHEP